MNKYVYMFDEGNKDMRDLLGGKGANLAFMKTNGFPVPNGFTITSEACLEYYKNDRTISAEIKNQIFYTLGILEKLTGKKLGDTTKPLLVSVRSGSRISMPGMMDTVLNLGMTDEVCASLAKTTRNPKFAYDSYRRFIYMFANVVKGANISKFESFLEEYKKDKGVKNDRDLTAIDFKEITINYKRIYKEVTGEDFPTDVKEQLIDAILAVFASWDNDRAKSYRQMNDIPFTYGTSVNIQEMVYGNMGSTSATGVAFTRNPSTGEKKLFGEFLIDAQGEDIVAGIRTPEPIENLKKILPDVYNEFVDVCDRLEKSFKDMQDVEFTIENGKLFMLQTRNGKRTGAAAIKIAKDLVSEGLITKEEAILKVEAKSLDSILHNSFKEESIKASEKLGTGLGASPGAATGKIVFSKEEAVQRSKTGEKDLILVRNETSAEDIDGMKVASGILTLKGGMTSHAAVVARGMAKCCVSALENARIDENTKTLYISNYTFSSDDYISIDGYTGNVYKGKLETDEYKLTEDYKEFMTWVDEIDTIKVRANADTPKDAQTALTLGATGIGLCRTEHMFFAEDRILNFRKMILASDTEERKKYLEEIKKYQIEDFTNIFKMVSPNPITVRYLDPPLHEFLPKDRSEILYLAESLNIPHNELKKRIDELKEVNPMMGHRGCRLLLTYPEIVEMQTSAIITAQEELLKEGKEVEVEIMIPLVTDIRELYTIRKIIDRMYEDKQHLKYKVGTMIETPRAAITSREIARVADFYSFGTNDLTQLTYGFSRDDSQKFLNVYAEKGILETNPFNKIDFKGVGKLIEIASREAKKEDESMIQGVCGEQGADPDSIKLFLDLGIDYVSCSPYRVPIARLAAAQAAIKAKKD